MAGSLAGLVGVAALYRAIALGVASIAAPISSTGAILPVAFGLLRGEHTSLLQNAGMALALLGVLGASRTGEEQAHLGDANKGLLFAILAALGFGGFFILLHEVSIHDMLWAVTIQRVTGFGLLALIALVRRPARPPGRKDAPKLVAMGRTLDQTANVLYGCASTLGLMSLSAVLVSLYPLMTVLLAHVVLNERISVVQRAGGSARRRRGSAGSRRLTPLVLATEQDCILAPRGLPAVYSGIDSAIDAASSQ